MPTTSEAETNVDLLSSFGYLLEIGGGDRHLFRDLILDELVRQTSALQLTIIMRDVLQGLAEAGE